MRSIILAVLAAIALFAVPVPVVASAQTSPPSPRLSSRAGCHSLTERQCSIKRARVHRVYRFCNSWACVVRVGRKRAWREAHYWTLKRRQLSAATLAWLGRLRFCESTNNYRATNGQYTGGYQYADSTWARAGGHGRAMDASPAEQDVRTAWFYPSHRGEWACSA